ncbi:FdtA/QdtA family cupin domain-containing protein [Thalassovita sp.]|uniref:sugar 3,4-ketoisomerase n=1 Tax=Thalassovita sp. TaxID=1979401 RepID=UPI002B27017F|nr:FdtA/QdtA family cupin domain-containing protein [Thalassovita sp.]
MADVVMRPKRIDRKSAPVPQVVATAFEGQAVLWALDAIEDETGSLASLDFAKLGFAPVRAFTIGARDGAERGGHGHYKGRQLLLLNSGRVTCELCRDDTRLSWELGGARRALLIGPGIWSRQSFHGHQPAITVLCDTPYDPDSYFECAQ